MAVDPVVPAGRRPLLRPQRTDVLLALLVTTAELASLVARLPQVLDSDPDLVHFVQPDPLGVGLLLVSTLSIAWRRRLPLTVLLVTSAGALAHHELGYAPAQLPYGPLMAVHALALLWQPRRSLAATGLLVLGVVPLYLTRHSPIPDDDFIAYVLSITVAWALGYGLRLDRVRAGLLAERAVRLAREQDMRAQLAVQHERARIARDLHDVVSHHLCLMVAQSTAVQCVSPAEPEQALRALRSIETVGRRAMVEMRRIVGVLQPGPPEPGSPEPEPIAQPGLDRLGTLLADARRSGLAVELVVHGTVRALPAEVEANAYLIIQEALTNVLRHARPARTEVFLGYGPDRLRLWIRDEGGRRPEPTAGHGLAGILQRVTMLGGRLAVGPRAASGFEVDVELPLPANVPAAAETP